jgi:hypothetical protein
MIKRSLAKITQTAGLGELAETVSIRFFKTHGVTKSTAVAKTIKTKTKKAFPLYLRVCCQKTFKTSRLETSIPSANIIAQKNRGRNRDFYFLFFDSTNKVQHGFVTAFSAAILVVTKDEGPQDFLFQP